MYVRTPLLLLALVATFSSFAQSPAEKWADSVYAALTPAQRIGQLFMVAAYSNKGPAHEQELLKQMTEYYFKYQD